MTRIVSAEEARQMLYDITMFLVALDDGTIAEVVATDCKIVRGGA